MEDDKKINLRQYSLKKVSKKYLLRIVLYIFLLFGISWMAITLKNNQKKENQLQPNEIQQIEKVTIEVPDSI